MPPAIIYLGSGFDPDLGTPPCALGITNRVDQLLQFVLDAVERRRRSNLERHALLWVLKNVFGRR
jgi:hypothetical protein